MANLEQHPESHGVGQLAGERREELRVTERALGGSNATLALLGVAAATMALIGLGNVIPLYLAGIATIALGAGLLIASAATAERYQKLSDLVPVRQHEQAQIGGGLTVELIGGAAGIGLGVLALIGIEAMVLLPIAVLLYGATFLLSGGVQPALETWVERGETGTPVLGEARRDRVTRQAVSAGAGTMALAGIAAAILGILALARVGEALALSLVALLALGIAAFVSGSAFSVRMNVRTHHD